MDKEKKIHCMQTYSWHCIKTKLRWKKFKVAAVKIVSTELHKYEQSELVTNISKPTLSKLHQRSARVTCAHTQYALAWAEKSNRDIAFVLTIFNSIGKEY